MHLHKHKSFTWLQQENKLPKNPRKIKLISNYRFRPLKRPLCHLKFPTTVCCQDCVTTDTPTCQVFNKKEFFFICSFAYNNHEFLGNTNRWIKPVKNRKNPNRNAHLINTMAWGETLTQMMIWWRWNQFYDTLFCILTGYDSLEEMSSHLSELSTETRVSEKHQYEPSLL